MRYTGAARNLCERLRDHHAECGKRTKNQRPLHLIYHETALCYSDVMAREAVLKSVKGWEWLDGTQTVSP
jgi:predicted GIY-YIG superfamily endonuclease